MIKKILMVNDEIVSIIKQIFHEAVFDKNKFIR